MPSLFALLQRMRAREGLCAEQRTLPQIERAGMQRVERSREVAAIHSGDSQRSNRVQGFNVVPVVDMAAIFLQPVVCVECSERRLRKFRKSHKPQLMCGLPRIQQHSQVRWRQLPYLVRVLLLDVVRNKPVILLSAKIAKISPGVERLLFEKHSIGFRERTLHLPWR